MPTLQDHLDDALRRVNLAADSVANGDYAKALLRIDQYASAIDQAKDKISKLKDKKERDDRVKQ